MANRLTFLPGLEFLKKQMESKATTGLLRFKTRDFFRQLAECPGVYLMRDASNAILYVGHCFCYEQSPASISASVNANLEVLTGAFRSLNNQRVLAWIAVLVIIQRERCSA